MAQYPLRPHSHDLETKSRRFFENSLPSDWVPGPPQPDYGVDLRVDIFENGAATGLELLVQLKASQNECPGPSEALTLKVSTYNYLWDKLQVVMLIKYVEDLNQGYWILLKDVPKPDPKATTFTVHIPKENSLGTISWTQIRDYIRGVTDKKLAATRVTELKGK